MPGGAAEPIIGLPPEGGIRCGPLEANIPGFISLVTGLLGAVVDELTFIVGCGTLAIAGAPVATISGIGVGTAPSEIPAIVEVFDKTGTGISVMEFSVPTAATLFEFVSDFALGFSPVVVSLPTLFPSVCCCNLSSV